MKKYRQISNSCTDRGCLFVLGIMYVSFRQAYYDIVNTRTEEVTGYRTYSPSNSYIYITSSTEFPKVNFPSLVQSNLDGNHLVFSMTLKMPTFSLTLIWMQCYFQVDEYMVFTVATNTFVEEVYYLVNFTLWKFNDGSDVCNNLFPYNGLSAKLLSFNCSRML